MKTIEKLLDWGGTKKDILFLVLGGIALLNSMFSVLSLPFNSAWITVVLCGIPIILEAIVGLVTAFDIKADVLVSLALLASLGIGEYFCGRRDSLYYAAGRSFGGTDGCQSQGRN